MAFGADRIEAHGQINGIDRDRAAAMLTAVSGLLATLPPAAAAQPGDAKLSAPARAALRAFIASLSGIVTGVHGEETIEGMHIAVAGQGEATVRQVRLGIDGAAPDGILHAAFDIALDGLAVQDQTPQIMALMPHRLEVRPSIAGVSLADLASLALEATGQDADQAQLRARRRDACSRMAASRLGWTRWSWTSARPRCAAAAMSW